MIRLENVLVTFREGTDMEIRALDVPMLHIQAGCWCNVIGPNGSGKTTLVKVLSGGIESFRGALRLDGHDVTNWRARQLHGLVQVVEQSPERNTVPSMTIEENLLLYSHRGNLPSLSFLGRDRLSHIRDLLAQFEMNLENRLSSQVGLLSGGQKQAVALAAVLLREPKVLLLDEFLASIDPRSAPKLLAIVQEAARERGMTVVMISHDLKHVESTGDRLLILSSGRVADDLSTAGRTLGRAEIVSHYSTVLETSGVL